MSVTKTVLQIVHMDETGDSYHRMRWPARDLATQEPAWRVINLQASARERLEWAEHADLLVLFQSMDYDLLPIIAKRRRANLPTLVEYNDNFYSPQPWSPVAREWSSPRLWSTYETFMRESDGVIVTGEGLAALFSARVSKPVHVLENHLPGVPLDFPALENKKTPYFSFGWAGSLGHIADLLAIAPVVRELLDEIPGSKFHVMGNEAIPGHLNLPADRVVFTKWGGMTEYLHFWEPVHVGVAPLLDTPYNRCRSDVKAVEMSGAGVVPVLSQLTPYENFLSIVGMRGARTFADLKSAVLHYARDSAVRLEDAKRCHAYVATSRVGPLRQERRTLYSSVMEGRPAPNAVWPKGETWPEGAGYHEVKGVHHPYLLSAAVANEIQGLITRKEFRKAMERAKLLRDEQPLNPDAWLIELKFLRAVEKQIFRLRLKEAREAFPRDLRFALLEIESIEEDAGRRAKWADCIATLEREDEAVRRFHGPEIVAYAVAAFPGTPHLIDMAERLLALYPEASNLRFVIAELLERAGEWSRALAHFETLAREKEAHSLGGKFLDGVELSYVEAWKATLRARSEGA